MSARVNCHSFMNEEARLLVDDDLDSSGPDLLVIFVGWAGPTVFVLCDDFLFQLW